MVNLFSLHFLSLVVFLGVSYGHISYEIATYNYNQRKSLVDAHVFSKLKMFSFEYVLSTSMNMLLYHNNKELLEIVKVNEETE